MANIEKKIEKYVKKYLEDGIKSDPYICVYLSIRKEDEGENFNLEYELGSYINTNVCSEIEEGHDRLIAEIVSRYNLSMVSDGNEVINLFIEKK